MKEPEGKLVYEALCTTYPSYRKVAIRCYRTKPREWWVFGESKNWLSIRCKSKRDAIAALDSAFEYMCLAIDEITINDLRYEYNNTRLWPRVRRD